MPPLRNTLRIHDGNPHAAAGQAAESCGGDGCRPVKPLGIHSHGGTLAGEEIHNCITAASAAAGEKPRRGGRGEGTRTGLYQKMNH